MAAPGLDELTQASWSGGMCRSVARHLIPGDAAYDLREALLDDDGNVYQRGPTARVTSNQLGTSLLALWEGQFSAGRRMFGVSGTDIGVVATNTWIVNGAGLGGGGGGLAAQIGELMFFPYVSGGVPSIGVYGGSLKTANYSTGTVTCTPGSATITGAGTLWLANADAGMILYVSGTQVVVKSVDSNTQLTLVEPWPPNVSLGGAYGLITVQGAGTGTAVAAVQGRLLIAEGRRVRMSNTIDPATGRSRWGSTFAVTDFHEFPADVVALATLRDTVFVFTKAGIWTISNAALPIVDAFGNPQHRVQKVSGDVVLRSTGGVAPWRDSLVVCAVDGVYVMDASGALELISRSIGPLWQAHMAAGHQVYQVATFRDHVFMRVGAEMLTARLDRRTKTQVGSSAPWTRSTSGELATCVALAVQDPYGSPKLVGGSSSGGYLLDLTGVFRQGLPAAAGGSTDSNGSAVGMYVETREYVLDAGAVATVRDVAVEYESTDGTINVKAAVGQRATPTADPTYTTLAVGVAGNYSSQNPRVIGVRREARRVSYVLQSGGDVSGWRLRAVRSRSRLRGRRR